MQSRWFAVVGLREHADEALLEGVNVAAHLAGCAGMNEAASGDDADLAAQCANLLRVVAAEKRGHAVASREPAQKAPTTERVTEIQTALQREGFDQGDPSGKWDAGTQDAMRRFQIDRESARADYYVPFFLSAAQRADSAGHGTPSLRAAARRLAAWDRHYAADDTGGAALFEAAR